MKKLFLILLAASALSFQACKTGTADKDDVIDDGMNTSETTFGTGSTRPSDRNTGSSAAENNGSTLDNEQDTANTSTGSEPIETAPVGNNPNR